MDPTAHSTNGRRFQACLADRRASQLRCHVGLWKASENGLCALPLPFFIDQAEVPLHFQLELPSQPYG